MFGNAEVCKDYAILKTKTKKNSVNQVAWEAAIFLERGFISILVQLKKEV
jgi:hypothetical protein